VERKVAKGESRILKIEETRGKDVGARNVRYF
jgi:hypothetical protein